MPRITYNSYVLPLVIDKFSLSLTYDGGTLSCNFLVLADTEANLVTLCTAAETALRQINKDLLLEFGPSYTDEYSFSHAANTGYLAQPTLSKIPNKLSNALSREYQFTLNFQLPADAAGYNYRKSGEISVSEPAQSRKALTVSGVYTAGGANSAANNYATYGESWADAIAASFGTYELQSNNYSYDHENKALRFNRQYTEKLTIAVTYNSYVIPTSYNNFTLSETYTTLTFSCEFKIPVSSSAAAETALRQWNKDLVMTFGGAAAYSYSHTNNTGFLAQPTLTKISNKSHGDTDRFYRFSLSCQLPADASGYNYRQAGTVSISEPQLGRKTATIRGKYTAGGANSALVNYATYGLSWANSIAAGALGTAELIHASSSYEQEGKILDFSLVYQEQLNLVVVYNSYTIPTSYNNFTWSESYESATFSCEFSVATASAATAEVALRENNKDLTVTIGGVLKYGYAHSTNTGLLTRPSLTVISNKDDSQTTRHYRFSVTCQLPADSSGYGFRQSGSYAISYGGSRRKSVSFTGVYTAGGSDDAEAKYNAGAGGKVWAASVLSAIGGTYELTSESVSLDHEKKIANVGLTYLQQLAADSSSGNSANIINAVTDYRANFGQEKGFSNQYSVIIPVTVNVSYSAELNCETLSETQIESTYQNIIKPWIISRSYTVLGLSRFDYAGQSYVTQSENFSINPHTYRFAGNLVFSAMAGFDRIISLQERISIQTHDGLIHKKIYDGTPNTYSEYNVGAKTILRRNITIEALATAPGDPLPPETDGSFLWRRIYFNRDERKTIVGDGPRESLQQQTIKFYVNFSDEFIKLVPVIG